MNILILGATGFIGNSIFLSTVTRHNVILASRKPLEGYEQWRKVDFETENNWDILLKDIDMVINAIGVIKGNFRQIQVTAPSALFRECISRKIKIINISAIGAEKPVPPTEFLRSKKITDELVLNYPLGKVIYPGIVIGKKGKSTQFFSAIAALPLIPLFEDKPMPLIHISQLCAIVQQVIEDFDTQPQQIFAVAESEKLSELLSALKGKKIRSFTVPEFLIRLTFVLFPKLSFGLFNKDTLTLFESTNVSDYPHLNAKASSGIQPESYSGDSILIPLAALLAISFIWIWSGISSLIVVDESYKLMAEIGAGNHLAIVLIALGSAADIILGIAVFSKRIRRPVLLLQMSFIVIYTLILTLFAPHYWLHPFGVLSKNIPLIALSAYLYVSERRG